MKFRRIRSPDGSSSVRQAQRDGEWKIIESSPSAFKPEWELEAAGRLGLSSSLHLLPIQPLCFRDFMPFERHAVDAARGYTKRFMPGAYRLARGYDWFSGKTLPPFTPAPLWYRQPIYYMVTIWRSCPAAHRCKRRHERELGFVLVRPLFNASPEEAAKAIGAFVVLNDFSARDVQLAEMRSGFGP